LIDRGLRVGDELVDVGVVHRRRIADDRHRGVVEHRVAGEREEQR
jgi:hypothetical protein